MHKEDLLKPIVSIIGFPASGVPAHKRNGEDPVPFEQQNWQLHEKFYSLHLIYWRNRDWREDLLVVAFDVASLLIHVPIDQALEKWWLRDYRKMILCSKGPHTNGKNWDGKDLFEDNLYFH